YFFFFLQTSFFLPLFVFCFLQPLPESGTPLTAGMLCTLRNPLRGPGAVGFEETVIVPVCAARSPGSAFGQVLVTITNSPETAMSSGSGQLPGMMLPIGPGRSGHCDPVTVTCWVALCVPTLTPAKLRLDGLTLAAALALAASTP